MSAKQWIEKTHAKGIIAKAGRYGGTYAYKDIALELLQNNGVIRILIRKEILEIERFIKYYNEKRIKKSWDG